MSHFTVMVLGDNPEEQLAPFQENNMGDCPKEYLEFNDCTEEVIKDYEEGTTQEWHADDHVRLENKEAFDYYSSFIEGEEFEYNLSNVFGVPVGKKIRFHYKGSKDDKEVFYGLVEECNDEKDCKIRVIASPVEKRVKDEYETLEESANEYSGYNTHVIDGEKRYGYYENPNCKWDWYQLGGRWTGFFRTKEENVGENGTPGLMTPSNEDSSKADQCLKSEIDFEGMEKESRDKARETFKKIKSYMGDLLDNVPPTWTEVREAREAYDIEKAREIYGATDFKKKWSEGVKEDILPRTWSCEIEDYCLDKENPEETYVQQCIDSAFATFAVIKDGKWYERGSMGWWGAVSDEKELDDWNKQVRNLIQEVSDDTLISIYDCHI
jgi:hypothetical protein